MGCGMRDRAFLTMGVCILLVLVVFSGGCVDSGKYQKRWRFLFMGELQINNYSENATQFEIRIPVPKNINENDLDAIVDENILRHSFDATNKTLSIFFKGNFSFIVQYNRTSHLDWEFSNSESRGIRVFFDKNETTNTTLTLITSDTDSNFTNLDMHRYYVLYERSSGRYATDWGYANPEFYLEIDEGKTLSEGWNWYPVDYLQYTSS
jgi:hypothetical protein